MSKEIKPKREKEESTKLSTEELEQIVKEVGLKQGKLEKPTYKDYKQFREGSFALAIISPMIQVKVLKETAENILKLGKEKFLEEMKKNEVEGTVKLYKRAGVIVDKKAIAKNLSKWKKWFDAEMDIPEIMENHNITTKKMHDAFQLLENEIYLNPRVRAALLQVPEMKNYIDAIPKARQTYRMMIKDTQKEIKETEERIADLQHEVEKRTRMNERLDAKIKAEEERAARSSSEVAKVIREELKALVRTRKKKETRLNRAKRVIEALKEDIAESRKQIE